MTTTTDTRRRVAALALRTGDDIECAGQWSTVLSTVDCYQPGHSTHCIAVHTAARVHHVDAGDAVWHRPAAATNPRGA